MTFKKLWLGWLVGWANLLDGVCLVVTLGKWCPEVSYRAEFKWLDCVEAEATKEDRCKQTK
jgi:hypothetical protein